MEGYNISVIGKSGVGKSSLLNYLFGEIKADVGVGKPVTLEGFHLKKGSISGNEVNIYDSWGLEAGKEETWRQKFKKFQKEKQQEKDVKKWLHTVIYCISGEGKRIEDFEIRTIKAIQQEKLKPVIVITKGDSRGAKEFSEKVNSILGVETILVNNVEKTKGFGALKTVSEPFGKKELVKKIKLATSESLADRIKHLFDTKIASKKKALKKRLYKTLEYEIEKCSFLGFASKEDLDKIQGSLNKTVKSENRVFSNELLEIATEAKQFYKDTIVNSVEVDLGSDLKYSLGLEEQKEENPEVILAKIVANAGLIALIPVTLIPSVIFFVLDKIAPTVMNKIPMYSSKEVLQVLKDQLLSEKRIGKILI